MKKIYLAGPDVFRVNPLEYFEKLKVLCLHYEFKGLSPFDNENFNGELFSKDHSINVFKSNINLIKKCDIIIANLVPFRGACIDDGTAWELGYGYFCGHLLYGYTSYCNVKLPHQFNSKNNLFEYPHIESFGDNCVNLMIQESIESSGGKIMKTFEDCLVDCFKYHTMNY